MKKKRKTGPAKSGKSKQYDQDKRHGFKDKPNDAKEQMTVQGSNDPAWWISDDQTLKDVARLPFATQIGVAYDWSDHLPRSVADPWCDCSFCSIDWAPAYGESGGFSSPLNVSMQKFYATIRKEVAGSLAYEPNDLGLYMVAYDSIVMMLSYVRRLLTSMNLFSYTNLSMPTQLYTAQGGSNYEQDRNDLPALRARYNTLVRKASVFNMPDVYPIIKRHAWMSSQFYADQATNKAQLYIFRPSGYLQWNDTAGVVYCEYKPLGRGTISTFLDKIDTLLISLINSTDVSNINMSILKAFGSDHMYKLALLSEDEVPAIVYDREVLMEIENLRSVPSLEPIDSSCFSVRQVSGCLMTNYRIDVASSGINDLEVCAYAKPFLNMRWDNPTAADVMVATSMAPVFKWDDASSSLLITPRAEVIGPITVWQGPFSYEIQQFETIPSVPAVLSSFDWHPIHFGFSTGGTPARTYIQVGGDIDNFTWASPSDLRNIHNYALMNAFNL